MRTNYLVVKATMARATLSMAVCTLIAVLPKAKWILFVPRNLLKTSCLLLVVLAVAAVAAILPLVILLLVSLAAAVAVVELPQLLPHCYLLCCLLLR